MSNTRVTLEIAVQSLADAQAAERGGADRLELCVGLELHGLTPSSGLIRQVRKVPLPMLVMIRPRAGGFCYVDHEIEQMVLEIRESIDLGADGFVLGCLHPDGTIDTGNCRRLLEECRGRTAVFHRAFDLLPDAAGALEVLVSLGFARLLTSGGQASTRSAQAREQIASLQHQAGGRITIMPGGGIRADNVASLLTDTGCTQVHAACLGAEARAVDDAKFETIFGCPSVLAATKEPQVRALREALDRRP